MSRLALYSSLVIIVALFVQHAASAVVLGGEPACSGKSAGDSCTTDPTVGADAPGFCTSVTVAGTTTLRCISCQKYGKGFPCNTGAGSTGFCSGGMAHISGGAPAIPNFNAGEAEKCLSCQTSGGFATKGTPCVTENTNFGSKNSASLPNTAQHGYCDGTTATCSTCGKVAAGSACWDADGNSGFCSYKPWHFNLCQSCAAGDIAEGNNCTTSLGEPGICNNSVCKTCIGFNAGTPCTAASPAGDQGFCGLGVCTICESTNITPDGTGCSTSTGVAGYCSSSACQPALVAVGGSTTLAQFNCGTRGTCTTDVELVRKPAPGTTVDVTLTPSFTQASSVQPFTESSYTFVFNSTDWNTPQSITFALNTGATSGTVVFAITLTSTDPGFEASSQFAYTVPSFPTVSAVIYNSQPVSAGTTVPANGNGATTVTVAGVTFGSFQYPVTLSGTPTTVTISAQSGSCTVTPASYDVTPQYFSITYIFYFTNCGTSASQKATVQSSSIVLGTITVQNGVNRYVITLENVIGTAPAHPTQPAQPSPPPSIPGGSPKSHTGAIVGGVVGGVGGCLLLLLIIGAVVLIVVLSRRKRQQPKAYAATPYPAYPYAVPYGPQYPGFSAPPPTPYIY